jgi:hypothetical protein
MAALADIRNMIAAHTVRGCGMSHHFKWAHGVELPPCPVSVREHTLDCAHSMSPQFKQGVDELARDPRVPLEVIQSVRRSISVARDILWVADLVAIELSDASDAHFAGRSLDAHARRSLSAIGVTYDDGSLNTGQCEAVLRERQAVGGSLMLSVRSLILSAIDLLQTGASAADVATKTATSRALLDRNTDQVESEFMHGV